MKKQIAETENCADCALPLPPPETHSVAAGYATVPGHGKICYDCSATRERNWMIERGKITLYLVDQYGDKAASVQNWTGRLKFPVHHIKSSRHNVAGRRYDFWFTGPDGRTWHGRKFGDETQIAHCRRTNEKK